MNVFDWIILCLALSIIIILLADVYFHNCAFTTAVKKKKTSLKFKIILCWEYYIEIG